MPWSQRVRACGRASFSRGSGVNGMPCPQQTMACILPGSDRENPESAINGFAQELLPLSPDFAMIKHEVGRS